MATEKPQRDPVLAAMEAKAAAWTAAAESYRKAMSLDGPLGDVGGIVLPGVPAAGSSRVQGYDLPVGIFRDKGLKEAIPIYLAAGRRKQTNKEIATGLQVGGFPTMAENFEATVGTALYRLKNEGVLLRFPDGWDLASSYPDGLRSRLEKDAKPRRNSGGKPAKSAKRPKPSASGRVKTAVAAKPTSQRRTAADGPSIDQRILKILTAEGPGSPATFATRLEKPVKIVGMAFGRLRKLGKVEKLANGNYAAAKQESALRAV
jgi:hypothetical protein